MNGPKPPPPPPPKPYPAMSFQMASGDPNNKSGFGEKAAIQYQYETRTEDIDLLPLSERKRMLICHDMPSNGLNARQVIPDFGKEWPGLPKGVKFDPSDEELLWHLLAEIGKGAPKRHPFIKEFIVFLDEDDGLGNVHPQFLPGVKQDGSISYFFHRKVQMYSRKKFKRLKQHDGGVEFCWHSNGKFNLVCVDGIHQGSKEVLTLYMNPANDGNPLRTPWLMHQYHIGIDGAEEDLVVSKIFYEMKKDSMDGFKTEVVSVATPLQVAPEFHEKLHVESVSVDESILAFATRTPAELTTEELSQKVMNHGIGGETNAEHVGYLKSASSQNYGTKYLEKSSVKHYKRSEGTFATDELLLLESSCETATFNDQKECVVGKRPQDGFLAYSGDLGISVNNSIYDKVIGDDTCDSNDTHISMEKSCPERAPEHVLQKNVFDRMFKTQSKFIGASRSVEINTTGICSFMGHLSREKHETNSNCLDEAHVSPSRVSSAKHSIARVNAINELFILGLPAFRFKAKPSEETESKFAFEKNSNTWANISVQSDLPIKIEPTSFKDAEIGIASENFSINRSNASELSGLLDKVKAEPFEGADASIILEKCDEELPSFSQSSLPDNSSNCVNFCYSKDNIQEKNNPHFYISKEGTTPCCNLFHQDCIPDDLHIPIDEILSTKIFGMDELLSETNCFINEHPEKDDNVQDGLLMNNDNSQVMGDSDYYPQINVKSEPVENIDLTYSQIPPSNTREDAFLMFENKIELNSDSPLDTLDHAPLKCRLGISVSEGGDIVKSGNISEDVASVAPGCRSFGSVNTKKCQSASRRKRKKTATNSVEKAMEEDSPGLLKALLERGIQVEEIKLYGDLEDNDPLETSSSEGSFEELETVVTKLFSERSSLLRFTSGRSMKGSRGVYYLAGLISLIEQTRYLRFRHTPVDWGWCRDLQSFIFVFHTHNRIVLERPEYGYATYFFELVDSLPIDWQIKRLVKAMKLTNCSRTVLLENKTLIVGEDLSEGEAHVLEGYGWARNTGFGTLLNYVDRVVHDRRSVMYSSEWRAKIRKMLMSGYDGGRMVLANIPEKVVQYLGTPSSEIKMEL